MSPYIVTPYILTSGLVKGEHDGWPILVASFATRVGKYGDIHDSKNQEETEVCLRLAEWCLEVSVLRLSWRTACDPGQRPKQQLGQTSICGNRVRARSTKYELGLTGRPRYRR